MPNGRIAALVFFCFGSLFGTSIAAAQVPPSSAEIARFAPLHAAAHAGDVSAIRKLLAGGADIDGRDSFARTPLMVATYAGHPDAVAALIEAGANTALLERGRYDAVTIAAVDGNAAMVKLLLDKGARADLVTSVYDGTALIAAAHLGHIEVVRELIRGGAPLDHVNNLNWTALIEAVVLGDGGKRHTAVVKDLVAAGADITLPDRDDRTPLQLARERGYEEMAKILQAAGAKE